MTWLLLMLLGALLITWGWYRLKTRPLRYSSHPFDWWEHPPRHEPNRYVRKR